jgi:hypothetical protein
MNGAETMTASESDARRPRRILRSIGAVLAGFIAVAIISLATDVLLHATGVYPPWFQNMSTPLWLLATTYRILFGIGGGYISARLAPDRPMLHAMALGLLGLLASIAGVLGTWNKGPEFGPKWYPIALVITAVPTAWAGAKLFEMQSKKYRDARA